MISKRDHWYQTLDILMDSELRQEGEDSEDCLILLELRVHFYLALLRQQMSML
jgi:hypothetical protein